MAACCLASSPMRPAEARRWASSVLRTCAESSNENSSESSRARLRAGRASLLLGELGEAEVHGEEP